jgi:4-diphosphocytidyl-2C-methyl-D-erythritol kinase
LRRLVVSAFAKVNLGLEVLGLRSDGTHELRTLFQTIDLADRIVLAARPRAMKLRCDDPSLPVDEGNLALRIRGHLVVVEGGRPLSTATVFAHVDRSLTPRENSNTIFRFISGCGEKGSAALSVLSNDLEPVALEVAPDLEPRVRKVRELLQRCGARLAALSGSGASYFGFFDRAADAARAAQLLRREGIGASCARALSGERYRAAWDRSLKRRTARAGWSR